jgi:tRNA-dihydrouridine synthase C
MDYVSALRAREQAQDTSQPPPLLLLAPMENLADAPFRIAHASHFPGGFDEACIGACCLVWRLRMHVWPPTQRTSTTAEFMRVPDKANKPSAVVRGVCAPYNAAELPVPLGAQIMGSNPELLALAARYLVEVKGAPRVDLNCGCPANTVTGNGAGSR